jgi:hypothetical protein
MDLSFFINIMLVSITSSPDISGVWTLLVRLCDPVIIPSHPSVQNMSLDSTQHIQDTLTSSRYRHSSSGLARARAYDERNASIILHFFARAQGAKSATTPVRSVHCHSVTLWLIHSVNCPLTIFTFVNSFFGICVYDYVFTVKTLRLRQRYGYDYIFNVMITSLRLHLGTQLVP